MCVCVCACERVCRLLACGAACVRSYGARVFSSHQINGHRVDIAHTLRRECGGKAVCDGDVVPGRKRVLELASR